MFTTILHQKVRYHTYQSHSHHYVVEHIHHGNITHVTSSLTILMNCDPKVHQQIIFATTLAATHNHTDCHS